VDKRNIIICQNSESRMKRRCEGWWIMSSKQAIIGKLSDKKAHLRDRYFPSNRTKLNSSNFRLSNQINTTLKSSPTRNLSPTPFVVPRLSVPKHSHIPNLVNLPRTSAYNSPWLANEHNMLSPHVRNIL